MVRTSVGRRWKASGRGFASASAFVFAFAFVARGCGGGVGANSGARALLKVAGGQFFAGPVPAAANGPAVTDIQSRNNAIFPGQRNKRLGGRLGRGARAVVLALEGDAGYWVLPAGNPDVLNPGELNFEATISFSALLPSGERRLLFAAVDAERRFGEPSPLVLTVRDATPQGLLVVALRWDTESDLDLHVVQPDDIEIWAKNINAYQPPPPGTTPP